MAKVLISDSMHPLAEEIFQRGGITVDVKTGLKPEELAAIIGEYDGLAIRSSTKVTADILKAAKSLKVIGRAGIGVDNVDVPAATAAGVVVMNTPFGNSITTAEHAIAMMFALARDIPQASASTHAGKWEKSKFMGVELYAKTLGIVGCGNIGAIVASRAVGLQMNVIAFDPFLSDERAEELGVEKVSLEDLFARADFITLHTPLTDKTRGIINGAAMMKMKKGVRIINCARGGLIVEADLKAALDAGQVGGAALDVFEVEPATENVLFGHPKVVCTPHLGASTTEAQVNVAIQVAEQMTAFLSTGAVQNAVNAPSVSAEDAPRLRPYLALASNLGGFMGQTVVDPVEKIEIAYRGQVAELNIKPLTASIVASLLRVAMDSVNEVNALELARGRKIQIAETLNEDCDEFQTAITVTVSAGDTKRSVTGTLFAGKETRIVDIEGVPVEAALARNMLYIRNDDKPGLIGAVGSLLGNTGQNIADFRLGRIPGQDTAVCLISLDAPLPDSVFREVANLPRVRQAQRLSF